MIHLDRLAALCDAATQGPWQARVNREYIAALDPATVRQLIDAYKCLQRLVKIRDESEGIAIPEDNIDAIIAWKVKWDAAFTAARKIVKGG